MAEDIIKFLALLGTIAAEPELGARFDHDRFCIAVRDVERRANEARGKWLDLYTRHDGMTVDCSAHAVDLRLYVGLPFKEFQGNWRDALDYKWSDDYCTDPAWATAIEHRWKITLTIQSVAGERFSSIADCH